MTENELISLVKQSDSKAPESLIQNINRLLYKLSVEQRDVIILRVYHELELKEISEILNISLSKVKNRLYSGFERLKKEVASDKNNFFTKYEKEPVNKALIELLKKQPDIQPPLETISKTKSATVAALKRVHTYPFSLVRQVIIQAGLISRWFWLSSVLFTFTAIGLINLYENAMLQTILFSLTPIVFLIGIPTLFRNPDEGTLELESSCKYSPGQILLSRMVVVGIVNVTILLLVAIAAKLFHSDLSLVQLLVLNFSAFTLTACIGVLIVRKAHTRNTIILLSVLWSVILVVLMTHLDFVGKLIMQVSVEIFAAILLAGFVLLGLEIHFLQKNMGLKGDNWHGIIP